MTLADKAQQFKAALKVADTGPTSIAKEIVSISQSWEKYQSEAEDMSFKTWLREVSPGLHLHWWVRLAAAAATLGATVANKMHHRAVVYLVHSVPETYRAAVQEEVLSFARHQGAAVRPNQLSRIVRSIVPADKLPQAGICKCCEILRAQLRALGEEPEA